MSAPKYYRPRPGTGRLDMEAIRKADTEIERRFNETTRQGKEKSDQERKERRQAERVLIEGRWTHPDAPHGSNRGYVHFFCRCKPCSAAVADYRAKHNYSSRQGRQLSLSQ